MAVYRIEFISDLRWRDLVQNHPLASVFHAVPRLQSPQHAYSYKPVAFTSSSPNYKLENEAVFCRVRSWLTVQRLVSLPFARISNHDHDSSVILR